MYGPNNRVDSGDTESSDEQSQHSPTPPPASPAAGGAASSHSSTQTSSQTVSQSGNGSCAVHDGEYARKCRALLTLLRDLRDLGADSVFNLPKIVVIGSQSAGKSSLIEAVTGINVPRDSGTCTRCPMECTMSSSAESWTCSISLRRNTAEPGSSRLEPFGPDITDKGEVELWLRRAQGAILSTSADRDQWATKSAEEIKQATGAGKGMRMFTEDAIVVDIRDQGLTDLSFVDLPGLIQNAEQESIDLIRNLSQRHIEGNNTVILVTIPAHDDIQNHGAVVLAKGADIEGRRTIGVLTMPDKVGSGDIGAHEILKRTMQNVPSSRDYLQHGYYCVRLPDDKHRQQGYTAHNLPNPNFFDVVKPWSEVTDRGKFGVNNLVRDISVLLVQLVEDNLPGLRNAVEEALRVCITRLGQLPAAPQGDLMTNITLMVNEFLRQLVAASTGDMHKTLAQGCKKRYVRLREEILATCPEFRKKRRGDGDGVYDISDVRLLIEECTGWELPGFIPYETYERLIQRFLKGWKKPMETCFEDIYTLFSSFIDDLSDTHFASYRGLKLFVSNHARSELEKRRAEAKATVQKLLDLEKKPFFSQRSNFTIEQERWMQIYEETFNNEVEEVCEGTVGSYIDSGPSSPVYAASGIAYAYDEEPEPRKKLHQWPRPCEESPGEKWFASSGGSRRPQPQRSQPQRHQPHKPREESPQPRKESHNHRDELHVMATVRTYFQFAYERFSDTMLLMVEHELIQALRSNLETTLFNSLMEIHKRGAEESLLSEDPNIERERRELINRRQRLMDIRNRLDAFSIS